MGLSALEIISEAPLHSRPLQTRLCHKSTSRWKKFVEMDLDVWPLAKDLRLFFEAGKDEKSNQCICTYSKKGSNPSL